MSDQERLHELNLQVQQLQADKEKLAFALLLVLRETDPIQSYPLQITSWSRDYCIEVYKSVIGNYYPLEILEETKP